MADFVQPLIAVLYRDEEALAAARARFEPDYESPPVPFDVTDYYEREMGAGLRRVWWSLPRLGTPDELPGWKRSTLDAERALSIDGRRRVNLDPGYLDPCKLVLASLKYNGPKVYLRDGVYADVLMLYARGAWTPTPWCFADFRDGRYDAALSEIRARFTSRRRDRS